MKNIIDVIPRSSHIDNSMKFTSSENNPHLNKSDSSESINDLQPTDVIQTVTPVASKMHIDIFSIFSTYKYHILTFIIIIILILGIYILYKKYISDNEKKKQKINNENDKKLQEEKDKKIKDISKFVIDTEYDSDISEDEEEIEEEVEEEKVEEVVEEDVIDINNKLHTISNEIDNYTEKEQIYNTSTPTGEYIDYIINNNHDLSLYNHDSATIEEIKEEEDEEDEFNIPNLDIVSNVIDKDLDNLDELEEETKLEDNDESPKVDYIAKFKELDKKK